MDMDHHAERDLLASVSLEAPWSLVECFAQMRRETPEEMNRGGEEIAARLAQLGVPCTMYEPTLFLSTPKQSWLDVGGQTFDARPPSFAPSVPNGVTAGVIVVQGSGKLIEGYTRGTANLFGDGFEPIEGLGDVTGCVVAYFGTLNGDRIAQYEKLGAAAVVAINPGENPHWGGGCAFWGTPDTDDLPSKLGIPAIAVNRHAGEPLLAAAKAGESVRVVTALDEGWCQAKLPVVEIRGTEQPEQFVLLHGHYDSWDVGVGDNATGNAAMLEIARVLWQHRGKLKRSVRLAWWPGHSTGRFAGSTWYADRFAIDLLRNCVAQINCDSPGCRWATSYEIIPWMAENAAFVADVVRDAVGKPASGRRPPAANDYSFTNLGITGYLSSSSRIPAAEVAARGYYYVMGNGGNIEWHTVFDKFEIADRNILLDDMKVYLLAIWRNANAVLLPYDWSALLAEFADTVSTYQRAAGSRFDLAPARDAVAALQDSVARFERAVKAGSIPPTEANRILLLLSRHLVPLNYVRGTRFRRDMALPPSPLPCLAIAEELDRYPLAAIGFALTQLQRGCNHVVGGLMDARDLVDAALDGARVNRTA
jgi:N-acetylated-alpha-linked acidic dipeptidase